MKAAVKPVIKSRQMSESMPLAIFLTLAGGFQDAYSYNCRGRVFANAQTGNIVLLGQNLAQGHWGAAFRYFIPLCAFLLGVYITERVHHRFRTNEKIHWRQVILLIESLLLVITGFLPQTLNISANALMSFACAMQVNSFRKFHGLPCATTMCIGNIRSATEMLCRYHITKDKSLRRKSIHYYFVILIFAIGATAGALITSVLGSPAIWTAACLLLAGFVLMFMKEQPEP
ncbi:YoaK family protein [Blautia marasmi]|uniref:YoaK family protein n=1 Tax=Blautia marasmi TaxID=1917868 RepID=UPI00266BE0C3|nr:YoaK family protein [Blautia marasmi]